MGSFFIHKTKFNWIIRWNMHLNLEILRYFNPIGTRINGIIGKEPKGIPNNLVK